MNEKANQQCSHIYIKTTVAPTCVDKGYDNHQCQKCGETYKDNYTNSTGQHSGVGYCRTCGLNYFTELTSYMKQNANYLIASNSYGWTDSNPPYNVLWSYKPAQNQVEVSFTKTTSSVILFFITYYNNASGVYKWGMNYQIVSSGQNYQMEGILSANTLTDYTRQLTYTNTTFPSSMINDAKTLAVSSYRSNVGFFQAVLDMYGRSCRLFGYTSLYLGGLLE